MPANRVFTLSLLLFLAGVAGVTAFGLVGRWRQPDAAEAVAALMVGDVDGAERRELLQRVFELASASTDPMAQLQAAMAAVALDSETQFASAAARLGGESLAGVAVGAASRPEAALGDTVIANLLAALVAERNGDRAAAATRYAQVVAQGRLWRMRLAGRLATAGARRVG
jgi:hypothetical protein